jgi:chromatin segregation and condensation protein Rec8/ScpA/Scc1 (kleisin family)
MVNPQADTPRGRSWRTGPEALLRRIRDIVERGRIDVAQVRLGNLFAWLLARGRAEETPPTLGDACSLLEWASRLVLLKARRLAGAWEPIPEEVFEPWAGPPPELPLRRSWLAERVAIGPLSYAAPPREMDANAPPLLLPVAPNRLRAAMLAVLARANRPKLRIVPLPRFVRASVEACCTVILEHLGRGRTISLAEVAGEGRDARVATFLACLILARQGRVELEQDVLFADIRVRAASQTVEATA